MSTINAVNLELQLVQKINSATNELDLLALSTALRQLRTGAVFVVQRFADLPSAAANVGQLYFVVEDSATYVSTLDLFGVFSWQLLSSDSLNVVFTWGLASSGQLGDGTQVNKSSPVSTVGGGTNWCQISAGGNHTSAVKTDGTVWTWGLNTCGRLGDGTVINRSSPVTTTGGGTTWCAIGAGFEHTAAVKTDGTAWTWGWNDSGRLGDGTVLNRSSPVTVAGGGTSWCQISAGFSHTAAIKTDGTAWTWGFNARGNLGDGTTVNKSSPVTTAGGGTNWCQINAGVHTAAVKTDGTAWTWGCNTSGQLGDGTVVSRSSPVTAAGGGTSWCAINAGNQHTGAVKTDGTTWMWGCNSYGRLGDGTLVDRSSPVTTSGGGTTWCSISAGGAHTGAVKTDGTTWTWGSNVCGRLGDLTVINRSSPGTTVGGVTTWCQISAGGSQTAAIASRTF